MIAMTADPAGDVSQRARSGLIAAVSKHTFSAARYVERESMGLEVHVIVYIVSCEGTDV